MENLKVIPNCCDFSVFNAFVKFNADGKMVECIIYACSNMKDRSEEFILFKMISSCVSILLKFKFRDKDHQVNVKETL